jgi:hypothetical protein
VALIGQKSSNPFMINMALIGSFHHSLNCFIIFYFNFFSINYIFLEKNLKRVKILLKNLHIYIYKHILVESEIRYY